MKFSFLAQPLSLLVIFGLSSVACGGSSSETPMPLEPVPHTGPEPEFPSEEEDDPPEAPEAAAEAPLAPLRPITDIPAAAPSEPAVGDEVAPLAEPAPHEQAPVEPAPVEPTPAPSTNPVAPNSAN